MALDPDARQSLTAVYAGSFDPITNGHVDIIERTLQVFERVIVAVAFNPDKDSALFTPVERVEMIDAVFRRYGGRVLADSFSGLLVDYVEQKGAKVIVRGLRAVADFEYEFQMTMMNRHLTLADRDHLHDGGRGALLHQLAAGEGSRDAGR